MAIPKKLQEKRDALLVEQEATSVVPGAEPVIVDTPPAPSVPSNDSATPAPENPPAAAVAAPPSEDFEQKFRTAQGIADKAGKELRESREEISRLNDLVRQQMEAMDKLIANQAPPAPPVQEPPAAPHVPELPAVDALTEAEDAVLVAYDGLEAIIRKIARQEAIAVLGPHLEARVKALEEQFRQDFTPVKSQVESIALTAEQERANRFAGELAKEVKNCAAVHADPEFLKWISGMEDLSGAKYLDLYNQAVTQTFNVKVAARIQKEFLREKGAAPTPPPTPDPVAPAAPSASVIPAGLEDQIAPPRSSGGDVPPTPAVDAVTAEDVARAGTAYARNRTPENLQIYNDLKVRFARKDAAQSNPAVVPGRR
jgi:gas vesicle protein